MKLVLFILMNIALCSCKKKIDENISNKLIPSNFSEVFDTFWTGMNQNYVYWDIDHTNWDSIYFEYKPIFEKLNLNDSTDIKESVLYFKKITENLIDNHFQIIFTNPIIATTNIFPAFQRKQNDIEFHSPFDYLNVDKSYFDQDFKSAYDSLNGPSFSPLHVILATIKKKIIYFNCNTFSLMKSYNSPSPNAVKPVLDSLFGLVKNDSSNIKGLIIDVRNNFGGNLSDLNFLIGNLIEKPLHFGYSRYKNGVGRLDYTPWISAFITPQPGAIAVRYPIVVLTDNYTVSLAESIAMAVKALPNGVVIGEKTWGATGPLVANEVYNDGQFEIKNFLKVYTSSAEFKYIDNKIYENIGFPPNIPNIASYLIK